MEIQNWLHSRDVYSIKAGTGRDNLGSPSGTGHTTLNEMLPHLLPFPLRQPPAFSPQVLTVATHASLSARSRKSLLVLTEVMTSLFPIPSLCKL